jgi:hypothetical protein
MVSINCYMFHHGEGDQYLDWHVGLVFICLNRPTEGDVPIWNMQQLILTMNYILLYVFYCILLSVYVDRYSEYSTALSSSLPRLLVCLAHGKLHKAARASCFHFSLMQEMVHPVLFCSLSRNTCKGVAVFEDAQAVPVWPCDKTEAQNCGGNVICHARYNQNWGTCAPVCSALFSEIVMS